MSKRVSRRAKPVLSVVANDVAPVPIPEEAVLDLGTEEFLSPVEIEAANVKLNRLLEESRDKESVSDKDRFRVQLMRDHVLDYPDLYLEVYVAGPSWELAQFASLFSRARCTKAKTLEDADLVIFTGGEDVDPQLYGEEKHSTTRINTKRDDEDIRIYMQCLEQGIPMFGVCRGAQFLHVMNGGKLYQHVDNHQGEHSMLDCRTKTTIDRVSSVHHQMCRENVAGGMSILGTAAKARNRWCNLQENHLGVRADIEAFFYRETCCLGVQGHPEYSGYNAFAKWCLERIDDYVVMNPDTVWEKGHRRLKPEVLQLRNSALSITKTKDAN